MKPVDLPPAVKLMKFIVGKWISKPIYVAAELGIADMLAEGPKRIQDLAVQSNSHEPSLYRMMRALASIGVFYETEDKCFELTPMAECLQSGAMRSFAQLFNSEWSDRAWSCFLDSIKTGDKAFEKAHGMSLCDWLRENPQAAEIFNEANAIKAGSSHRAIIEAYDFSGIQTLTDVGGGIGVLMAEILAANPAMQGVVADLPAVIQKTEEIIQIRGLKDRCQAVECDFFKAIPSGSDVYLMSNILHDWSDEQCRIILKNCKHAMKRKSRLLVVEMIVPAGNASSVAKLLDLEMFVMTGGCERTAGEFYNLFESINFKLSRIIPTKEDVCIIEAIPL